MKAKISPKSMASARRAIRRVLPRVPARSVTARARLVQDLGVDSLKVAELSIALEDEVGRPIFLGELFAQVENPSELTVGELALFLSRA